MLQLETPTISANRRTWPVFLVSCHRSGSTLVRYLLDAHEAIACPPESKFLAALSTMLHYPQALSGLESLGVTRQDVTRVMGSIVWSVMQAHARSQGKRRWVDKTPNYHRQLDFIEEIFDRRVTYLFLVRHPLDTIASLQESACFNGVSVADPDIARVRDTWGQGAEAWGRHWLDVYLRIIAFATGRPERCAFVRYEDVVADPESVMNRTFVFLGEQPSVGLQAAAFRMDHSEGYQDWKIRTSSGVHRSSVDRWKAWSSETAEGLWRIVGEHAEPFGYGIGPSRDERVLAPSR